MQVITQKKYMFICQKPFQFSITKINGKYVPTDYTMKLNYLA